MNRYQEAINKLKEAESNLKEGQEVFIGGGWLRDIVNGVEPKDIDIFVSNARPSTDVFLERRGDPVGYYEPVLRYEIPITIGAGEYQ